MGKIMAFASSFLKEIRFGERISNSKKTKIESSTTPTTYIYRDKLDIKKKPKIKKQVKFDLEPKYQYPTEEESNEEQKKKNTSSSFDDHANNGVKVKILMKKKDATRLLLKCREGGVLEFMDVAQELVQIP
ncbi:hypothetical protein A4A49_55289 [Nicotiana attenuata]|uniref:DUF7890 domain-containing protein n=1 Tax=Nicotiana attenuata TaxID=49451 RepID=A0A1J6KT80_NICAT|nr:hypothetical protein A4A49_55289 [Nicotiana attenuata]